MIAKKGFIRWLPQKCCTGWGIRQVLHDKGIHLDCVLNIEVDREALIERITGRRVCPNCGATYHIKTSPPAVDNVCDKCGAQLIQRSDDKLESVVKRLEVYESQTKPLIEYYTKKNTLVNIDGNKSVEEVFEDIKRLWETEANDIY